MRALDALRNVSLYTTSELVKMGVDGHSVSLTKFPNMPQHKNCRDEEYTQAKKRSRNCAGRGCCNITLTNGIHVAVRLFRDTLGYRLVCLLFCSYYMEQHGMYLFYIITKLFMVLFISKSFNITRKPAFRHFSDTKKAIWLICCLYKKKSIGYYA